MISCFLAANLLQGPVTPPKVDVVKAEAPTTSRDEMQDDDAMGADYEQEVPNPMMKVHVIWHQWFSRLTTTEDWFLRLFVNRVFNLTFTKQGCTSAAAAVDRSAVLLTTEGKEILKNEIKEIAKSVLNPTESESRLATEEANVCIDETVDNGTGINYCKSTQGCVSHCQSYWRGHRQN